MVWPFSLCFYREKVVLRGDIGGPERFSEFKVIIVGRRD